MAYYNVSTAALMILMAIQPLFATNKVIIPYGIVVCKGCGSDYGDAAERKEIYGLV